MDVAPSEEVFMRRLIVPMMALSIAAVPAAVEAQTPRERGHMAGAGPGAMNPAARVLEHREALGLSLDQVRQLQQIETRIAAQNQPLHDQLRATAPGLGRGVAQQVRQRMQQMTPEQRQRMQQMTPEQRQQMRAQMEERQAGMQEQREQMRAQMEARREEMRSATPEQRVAMREEMRAQMEARREQMQERRGGAALRQANPEMRAQMEALRPVMQQLQENQRQARQEVQGVLTAQQAEQLRQLQQERAQEMRQRMQGMRERGAQRPAGAERPPNRMMRRGQAR
jgi:hypothetical protein